MAMMFNFAFDFTPAETMGDVSISQASLDGLSRQECSAYPPVVLVSKYTPTG